MLRRILFFMLMCSAGYVCFGQASALRDYVGMISQTFHPDIVAFMEKFQERMQRQGHTAAVRSIDHFLKGDSGTGFVYVAEDGKNYILTNYHVISQAYSLSVSFEQVGGETRTFSDLSIIAADETMDIALLSFAEGYNPFSRGLAFLNQPVQEGDDVYSAGFPGLGTAMIWQLGRGMVSNAWVRLPDEQNPGRTIGPFIQHTAQVDPGNSGGPLLVQATGVPTGFAVAGINTMSARYRQAANFSIPLDRVRSFLDASLQTREGADAAGLEERLSDFIEGLGRPRTYAHIAAYLSNSCTAENAEYALSAMFNQASRNVQNDIVQIFVHSPVEGMANAVGWTIENALLHRMGRASVVIDSMFAINDTHYTVNFNANNRIISSQWTNEYGIWQIRTFGDFAAGDKLLVQERADDDRLRSHPTMQIAVGPAHVFNEGGGLCAQGYLRVLWLGLGMRTYITEEFLQLEGLSGIFIPLRMGGVAFTPFGNVGMGFLINSGSGSPLGLGISLQGGLQFTTAVIPGLFFSTAFQSNLYLFSSPQKNIISFGIGYSL